MERISYQELPQGMFEKLMSLEELIKESGIDYQLIELVKLRVSQINSCAYCVDMHHKELKSANETELRMSSLNIWKHTPYFSSKERAVLQFAESLTHLKNEETFDDIFENLLQHFSKNQISYLTLAITQINTWTRMMRVFKFTPGNYQVQPK